MTPTAQRAGFVTGGRQLSGSASACAQTQAESAVKPGGLRCVAGTQANVRIPILRVARSSRNSALKTLAIMVETAFKTTLIQPSYGSLS